MKNLMILKQTLKQKAVKKVDTKKKPVIEDRTRKFIKLIPEGSKKWKPCDKHQRSEVEVGI